MSHPDPRHDQENTHKHEAIARALKTKIKGKEEHFDKEVMNRASGVHRMRRVRRAFEGRNIDTGKKI